MPYEIDIDDEAQLVHIRLNAGIMGEDIRRAVGEVYLDREWTRQWHIIWDFRRIDSLVVDLDDLKEIISFKETRERAGTVDPDVYLVTSPGVEEDIAKLYSAMAKRLAYTVNVCSTMDEALEEIGQKRQE